MFSGFSRKYLKNENKQFVSAESLSLNSLMRFIITEDEIPICLKSNVPGTDEYMQVTLILIIITDRLCSDVSDVRNTWSSVISKPLIIKHLYAIIYEN